MDDSNRNNSILKALDKTRKAMPSEAFIKKMENLALAYSEELKSFSKSTIIGIAAACLLLLMANFYVVSNYEVNDIQTSEISTSESYNLIPTKSIY